jgi:two-component system chemotaxis response regulator CheB
MFGYSLSDLIMMAQKGLKLMAELNGKTVIQDCEEAEYKTMPLAAKKIFKDHQELNTTNIIKLLNDEYK